MQCERFESNTFDLVWGCESGEHMPDKKRRTLSSSFFHILCGSPETCAAQVCRRDVTCPEAQRLGSFVDPTGAFLACMLKCHRKSGGGDLVRTRSSAKPTRLEVMIFTTLVLRKVCQIARCPSLLLKSARP